MNFFIIYVLIYILKYFNYFFLCVMMYEVTVCLASGFERN